MPTTKIETTSTNHKTSSIEKEKESLTVVNAILIAVVVVLTCLQLAEITGLYILHKKGIVQFKIGKKETVYADVKSDNTQVHVYSTMNRAEDTGNSNYYNEIH
ncbi:uncharacterized protein LOC134698981 [Mytilus trossulus]|uniref:uncharacterized protein LOC134698981 n=1 Tax=Mytilus trossulus TaxID=6551 RepID=UPI003005FD48